ncbi:bifunctional folylpolyglutamate synthase/dihydrofolate synthase [Notoacmeibacter ruber]|uniref:tetrahydrofolate synthase n=1 Tax=Notoacmeibacter ruber TaxID=2670375 RepID=A0A3L7JHI9_9HYPH|nr:folylpolyglutamate synthase/dihydrofolate synthase family protein [Notoacmeibacter ruber]RLQ89639.1 bifunctional folylpolyglutamate synthase/dihydrofolate synthase [Notoacmeibacter ruber]
MTGNKAENAIERLMGLHPKGFDLSLDRILRLMERLGNPHLRLPPVIHIAGTNGKGSAAAFCRALLEEAGLSCHVHISPHLVRWHERFRLGARGGGKLVDDDTLADALERVAEANGGEHITVFELLTATMFVLFPEHPADVAIIEVGLGGRFDATNIIPRPATSLIMPVALDHTAWLGDRVELVAAEKAGIIKPGCPVVIGFQMQDAARDVLVETAERLECPVSVYGQDFVAFPDQGRFVYQDGDVLFDLSMPRLLGRHQLANAAAAIAAVRSAGFDIGHGAVDRAMQSVQWPARMQRLSRGDLVELAPDNSEIWLDGGHNPAAGQAVAEELAARNEIDDRPVFLIAGMIDTKDQTNYFRQFTGLVKRVFTVPVPDSDASVPNDALAARAIEAGLPAEPIHSVANALKLLSANQEPHDTAPRILICGSLYLAGAVLKENGTLPD